MAERSVHEAAVEAFAEGAGVILTDYWREKFEAGIDALVASAEVREGLVAVLPSSAEYLADAILAALGGTEAE